MAITNAQQARQLYIKGGVVNPDGRRGFGGGATSGSSDKGYQGGGRDKKGSVSGEAPGAGSKSHRSNTPSGADDRGSPRQNYNTAKTIFDNTGKNPTGYDLSKGPPSLTEKEKQFVKENPPKRTLADFFDKRKKYVENNTPMKELCKSIDIADTVYHIVNDMKMMNGQCIDIDGGRTL